MRRVSLVVIERDLCQSTGARQHSVSNGQAGQRGGIEMRKRMKRIALKPQPLRGHVQKSRIKMGVMAHENGTVALVSFHCLPDNAKKLSQRDVFGNGAAKGVLGINARELEGRWIEVGPFKRLDIATMSLVDHQLALIRH